MSSEFDEDKIKKQGLVLETVAARCTHDAAFEDLRLVARDVDNGDILRIDNISGGYTNFTYKLHTKSAALFAKLCFPRALWNPDEDYYYDLSRIDREYQMMKRFAELAPGCVATPFFLVDIDGGKMKLLVTQWSPAGEKQLASNFIDGVVDVRVAARLGRSIGALHKSNMDPDFNTEQRECMIDLFPTMKEHMMRLIIEANENSPTSCGRVSQHLLVTEFDEDVCATIFERCAENYRSREIACHTDLHVFNILVGQKFDAQGSFCICDWEMAMKGPLGIDAGRLYAFPVACLIAHAISDDRSKGVETGIFRWIDTYWQEYAICMQEKGDAFLCNSFRSSMGWLGWKLFLMTCMDFFIPFLPIETSNIANLKESLTLVALQLLRWGFIDGADEQGPSTSTSSGELKEIFYDVLRGELSYLKGTNRKNASGMGRRHSSIPYEKRRRVSDSNVYCRFRDFGRRSTISLEIRH